MTHTEFAKLHYEDKCVLIKKKAVRVGTRDDNKFNYYLFQLEAFYLEIKTKKGSDEIESITCFGGDGLPDVYINHIDLDLLIK